ncbi:F-box only protein 40 [Bagarius yarrelli]|uniref:F-box only protein 40 n=1 Tax=Bagarius yarrelli TaxID=175774 RepID=A0A556UZC9_BAGYA|nr:F-box only protein 40 [Bagarius yarrelli]
MSSVLKELPIIIFTEAQMSSYRRSAPTSGKRLHRHCESCHSKYCKAPIEITLSCMIINCRLLCGASFHMCKEDEHILLCPNEKVPCINANYGCPFTMFRSKLAKHLEVCPASVVVCSMDWNRWPIEDIKSPFFSNLMKDINEHQALDLSTALRDQKQLCGRLKMRSFFPQLMQEPEEPIPTEEEAETGHEFLVNESHMNCMESEVSMNGPVNVDMKEYAAKDLTVNTEKYHVFEKMFSKERGGCKQAQEEELKKKVQKDRNEPKKGEHNSSNADQQGAKSKTVKDGDAVRPDISKTGFAPWQKGVLERLSQEVNPKEYNMYVVHHGRMLLSFGQIKACTPREEDFVYGSLEPIPVQTLRSFSVPISYRHKRIEQKDSATRVRTEHKSVDTSDLGLSTIEDTEKMDEMFATLLCAAEVEIRGHKISETVALDGLYIDIANQTYDFPAAPFGYNATLADITEDRDVKLYLQIDTECVTLRHNKNTSAFTFMCEHFFRRDEFASHFKNVHSDIQSCLNGWFEERCPLAYLGCTFRQRRLQPSTHKATVFFNQDLSTFILRPDIATPLVADSQIDPFEYENSLSDLPFEVLRQIAKYLDSFSLSQLALVSRLFRDVSATFLHDRGMVSLKWRKKLYTHGATKWKSSTGRQKTSGSKLHKHCENCHNRRCKVPLEISVSCMIINCRLLCGASFHMCKEDEHILLCPNEKVPCINVHYGCPFTMCRSKLAKHLKVCPASVVVCSMEWNRWPIEETEPPEFYKNVLKENYIQEPLDLSMALRDQRNLFQSLKMKTIFPELIEKIEEKSVIQELEGAVGGVPKDQQDTSKTLGDVPGLEPEERELTQEEREAIARDTNVSGIEMYDVWERMFSMELSGCKQTVKTLGTNPVLSTKELKSQENPSKLEVLKEETETSIGNSDTLMFMPHFNPYEMDEDKFLIAASLFACDTRPHKTFVYKHLEPMKIKTVRTFKVPTSFMARASRIRNPFHYKKESKAVDTADLSTEIEETPKWDEVQATLLCSLEKELRGHLIAESSFADAVLRDEGTQTYDFYSAPFKADASLADLTSERALQLHVQLQTESVTNRHNKCSSAFTYLCSHTYRRDEFSSHYKNVHSDIQFQLNGWFEHRCPLAYSGCTFSQRQLRPSTHKAMVSYDKDLSTFTLRPEVPSILYEGVRTVTMERKRARNQDALSKLPFEVLIHIAGFLDSVTLSQLALVSRLMREVCGILLQERGMVSLKWEKKTYSHGGWCWRAKQKVWEFSNLFYPVDNWCLDTFPSMSEHLKVCPYYEKEKRTEPVPLTGVFDCDEKEKAQNLVSTFINLCQDFCRVQDGKPGEPGVSGRDGWPGQKGDKGEPGLQVQLSKEALAAFKGDEGEDGPVGDIGAKGFSGSLGPPGPVGPPGNPGSSTGEIISKKDQAAFTAVRKTNKNPDYNRPVEFSEELANLNNDFNIKTGYFTCKIAGVYYFVFHSVSEGDLCLNLLSDNDARVSLKFCDFNQRKTSISQVMSGGVVIKLNKGHKVWLEPFKFAGHSRETNKMSKTEMTVFSGFLIFASG